MCIGCLIFKIRKKNFRNYLWNYFWVIIHIDVWFQEKKIRFVTLDNLVMHIYLLWIKCNYVEKYNINTKGKREHSLEKKCKQKIAINHCHGVVAVDTIYLFVIKIYSFHYWPLLPCKKTKQTPQGGKCVKIPFVKNERIINHLLVRWFSYSQCTMYGTLYSFKVSLSNEKLILSGIK